MNIAVYCVNYNSYSELRGYLQSLNDAADALKDSIHVAVNIADNSDKAVSIDKWGKFPNLTVKQYISNSNLGYFGGIEYAINKDLDSLEKNDYIIVSNVDLCISNGFFSILKSKQYNNDIGCIAPAILSESEHIDRNPKVLEKYSLRKLQTLRLMYKYPILNEVYLKTAYLKRREKVQNHESGYIYAPHGSFMLFTQRASGFLKKLNYPIFLFGEEIYVAEKLNQMGLRVFYDNELRVKDRDHASTSKMKNKAYYKYNEESIEMIIREFYHE